MDVEVNIDLITDFLRTLTCTLNYRKEFHLDVLGFVKNKPKIILKMARNLSPSRVLFGTAYKVRTLKNVRTIFNLLAKLLNSV